LNLPKSGDKLVAALIDLRADAGAGSPVPVPHPIAFSSLNKTVAFMF
jgi:hypothetical protein